MKFSNLKISIKLTIGFGIIMILAGILTLYCWLSIRHIIADNRNRDNLMKIIVLNYDLKNNLNLNYDELLSKDKDITVDFQKLRMLTENDKYTTSNKNFFNSYAEIIKSNELLYKQLIAKYNEFSITENDFSAIENEFVNLTKTDVKAKDDLIFIRSSNRENCSNIYLNYINTLKNNASKNEELNEKYNNLLEKFNEINNLKSQAISQNSELLEKINELINISKSKITSSESEYEDIFKSVTISILVFTVIAAILAVLVAEFIKIGLSKGINKGVGLAKAISNGDLTQNIDEKYLHRKDEIGELANSMNIMMLKLREIVSSVVLSSENITAASQEMSSNSQQLSQGASEQASAAEEVSSSIQQMSSNIQQNADNALQTEKIAVKAAKDIEEANNFVNKTAVSMKEIFDKVSIISDIAFQTNILALNAAVEAARAGEHGKGFAVVASEIRKLAERSQEAATEINELSKLSLDSAVVADEVLNKIVPDIQFTAKLVKDITSGSVEQNTGAEQINTAIQQLNQVIQQNAAAAEEMATSSEQLSAHAQQMLDKVNFFKTGYLNTKIKSFSQKNEKQIKKQKTDNSYPSPRTTNQSKGFKLNLGMSDNIDNEYERF